MATKTKLLKKIELPLDFKLIFLIQGMILVGVHDLYAGRQDMVYVIGWPVVIYILGQYLARIRYRTYQLGIFIPFIAGSIYYLCLGLREVQRTKDMGLWKSGYYVNSAGVIISNFEIIFFLAPIIIIACSMILWFLHYKKLNKWLVALVAILMAGFFLYLLRGNLRDGRLSAIKEALRLGWKNPWGGFTVTSLGINTSHCLWLDYFRDYGVMVFTMLVIFEVMTIIDVIRLIFIKKDSSLAGIILAVASIFYSCFYALEGDPMTYIYMWYTGLFVKGMLRRLLDERLEAEHIA